MRKRLLTLGLSLAMVGTMLTGCGNNVDASSYTSLKKQATKGKYLQIYDSDQIEKNPKLITERNGKLVVERCIGKVTNNKLDGRCLGFKKWHTYISYRGVKGAKKGDTVVTYFLYNPDNNYEDDMILRYDYIMSKGK